jgi:hypothetical protein
MSRTAATGPLLPGLLLVLSALAIALVVMGSYPVGLALLAVAIALLPMSIKSLKPGKSDDAG